MAFNWLKRFHQNMAKPPNYAEKSLAAYKLGMGANGSIAGVRIEVPESCCQAAADLNAGPLFHPDDAPHFPLPSCDRPTQCPCVYRPVMFFQLDKHEVERIKEKNRLRKAKDKGAKKADRKKAE